MASLVSRRVVARYLQATEFPTEEALKKYLQEHPDADRSKHTVSKGKGEAQKDAPEGEGKPEGKDPKTQKDKGSGNKDKDKVKAIKSMSGDVAKASKAMDDLDQRLKDVDEDSEEYQKAFAPLRKTFEKQRNALIGKIEEFHKASRPNDRFSLEESYPELGNYLKLMKEHSIGPSGSGVHYVEKATKALDAAINQHLK